LEGAAALHFSPNLLLHNKNLLFQKQPFSPSKASQGALFAVFYPLLHVFYIRYPLPSIILPVKAPGKGLSQDTAKTHPAIAIPWPASSCAVWPTFAGAHRSLKASTRGTSS